MRLEEQTRAERQRMQGIVSMGLAAVAMLGIAVVSMGMAGIDPAAAQGRGNDRGGNFDRGGGYDKGGGGYDRSPDRQMSRPPPQRQPLDFSYGRPDRRIYNERQEQWRPSRPSFFGR
jgi:hypothetical protein